METRRTIHYAGNTVDIPHPSRKNLKRRFSGNPLKKALMNDDVEIKPMTVIPKVCATTQCVWCAVEFESEAIRCRVCGNCQYCGMFCTSKNECSNCGNMLPPELRVDEQRRVVRFE